MEGGEGGESGKRGGVLEGEERGGRGRGGFVIALNSRTCTTGGYEIKEDYCFATTDTATQSTGIIMFRQAQ